MNASFFCRDVEITKSQMLSFFCTLAEVSLSVSLEFIGGLPLILFILHKCLICAFKAFLCRLLHWSVSIWLFLKPLGEIGWDEWPTQFDFWPAPLLIFIRCFWQRKHLTKRNGMKAEKELIRTTQGTIDSRHRPIFFSYCSLKHFLSRC